MSVSTVRVMCFMGLLYQYEQRHANMWRYLTISKKTIKPSGALLSKGVLGLEINEVIRGITSLSIILKIHKFTRRFDNYYYKSTTYFTIFCSRYIMSMFRRRIYETH